MLSFVRGDMFEHPADLRVNTVNCVGVMGAGVALAMKNRYPEMFRAYKRACEDGSVKPGEMNVWKTLTEWIVNFPTKRHWRDKSRYEDIEAGLVALRDYLAKQGRVRVTLPALGCGHGGLDWGRVSQMIRERLGDLDAQLFVFEPEDSVAAGSRAASETSPEVRILTEGGADYPARLGDLDVRRLYVLGDVALLQQPWLTIACSAKPDEREAAVASACVRAIAGSGITLALLHGGKLSSELSAIALEQGANVLLWAAQGINEVHITKGLHASKEQRRAAVISVAEPDERWHPKLARCCALVATALARAVLITDPAADLVSSSGAELPALPAVFYVRYGDAKSAVVERLRSIGARPISKRAANGTPNIASLLSAMAASAPMA